MPEIKSFPNNVDEYIGAEDVMRYLHGRTSGVFAAEGNATVTAVQDSMSVNVAAGIGWMANAAGNGVVWWSDEAVKLTLDPAESTGTLNRIDRIIVEWKTTQYADRPEIKVLKGTNASKAVAPALTNSNIVRQISLARVSIPAGTTALSQTLIIDERLDDTVCGLVTEYVNVDTSAISKQYDDLQTQAYTIIAQIKEALSQVLDGQIADGAVSNLYTATLNKSGWTQAGDYATQELTIPGLNPKYKLIVDVDLSDTTSAADWSNINDAWSDLQKVTCDSENEIVFYFASAPAIDIPVKVVAIKK